MTSETFTRLYEPGRIGQVTTKNRWVKTAQGSSTIEPDTGFVGERCLNYYENLAKGGIGLLLTESCGVEYPLGVHHPPVQFRLHDDALIPSFSKLAERVHQYDCRIFIQLIHSGPWNPTGLRDLTNARCSSTLTEDMLPGTDFVPTKEMTLEEVAMVQDMFVQAARRAYEAGWDGCEINAATCTLPNSFLSRVFNRRTDQYGADTLENRARFVAEIISKIRAKNYPNFAVSVILNIAEYHHPLATPMEEGLEFARIFEAAGAEMIQVRGHLYGHRDGLMHPDRFFYPELIDNPPKDLDWSNKGKGSILPFASAVKKFAKVPVLSAVRLDYDLGEKALRDGVLDYVGMTRRFLADPDYPNKVKEGRLDDIRPCLGCLHCMDVRLQNKYVQCRVNPRINRETEVTYAPAEKKKNVLVVGAGPSGMEAARCAAVRGHRVTIFDKQPKLGGLIPLAGTVKEVEVDDMMAFVDWEDGQFKKLGVRQELGQEVTPEVIDQLKPDVIIVAAGGKHSSPNIPGFGGANVLTSAKLHKQVKLALKFMRPQTIAKLSKLFLPMVGKNVVIIGGKIMGCETAEFLTKRGRRVTIVEETENLGEGMTGDDKYLLFPWFDKKGVKRYLGVTYKGIANGRLALTTADGKEELLHADTIVTTLPLDPNDEMMETFRDKAPEVYFIGDCNEPHLIAEATAAGALIAHRI